MEIELKQYNYDTREVESKGRVSTYLLARSLDSHSMAQLIDDYLNMGGKSVWEGIEIGKELLHTHPTLQRLAICMALGIILGMAEHDRYLDDRNKVAIETAKKIKSLYEAGEFPMGAYL